MRYSRLLLIAFAPLLLLVSSSHLLVAVSPYTASPRTYPTYERHIGSDESLFTTIDRRITDEENRRRSDDQEVRGRLADHDRLLGGLTTDARIVADRVTKIEERLFYVIGLLLGLMLTSVWNAIMSQRIHRRLRNGEKQDDD